MPRKNKNAHRVDLARRKRERVTLTSGNLLQGLRSVAEPGTDLHKVQVWFTDSKLKEDGDMYDIYVSYIARGSVENGGSCYHFFVAESRGMIVGCVGMKESQIPYCFRCLCIFQCLILIRIHTLSLSHTHTHTHARTHAHKNTKTHVVYIYIYIYIYIYMHM
jgi:hypothetical protein